MNWLFSTITLLVVFPIVVRAQERMTGDLEMSLGVRGGYGWSNITFLPSQTHQGRNSSEFGLVFRLAKTKYLGLATELIYSRTGYQTTEYRQRPLSHPVSLGQPFECRDTWLRWPLFMHLKFKVGLFSVDLLGGAYVDYLLSEHLGASASVLQPQERYLRTHNLFGLGIEGGAGLGYETPFGLFMFEYRTWYRLSNIYRRERIPKQNEPRSNVRNQLVGIAFYYKFF